MMEITQGKIVLVSGCSLSGKTQLISKLTMCFPHAKIVNFELVFRKNVELKVLYREFYNKVLELSDSGYMVIAESVSSFASLYIPSNRCVNIVVDPGLEKHQQSIDAFKERFGQKLLSIRAGNMTAEMMRKRVVLPRLYIPYNWNNFAQIKEAIDNYVGD